MNKEELLKKYLNGQCSAKEERLLFSLLQEDEADRYRDLSRDLWDKIQLDEPVSASARKRVYRRVLARTDLSTQRFFPSYAWKAVASVVGVVLAATVIWLWLFSTSQVQIATAYGETKSIVLPDGSQVKLNANSTLSYSANWSAQEDRTVVLEGEAYFQVTKQTNAQMLPMKFTVYAHDLAIQVVGTAFNVHNRDDRVQVVLTEGKVQLRAPQEAVDLTMNPGEWAEYVPAEEKIRTKNVNTDLYTTWKEDRYIFDNLSLREIAQLIESNYGVAVRFSSDSLAEKRMSATIPSTNLDDILEIIRQALQVTITTSPSQLYIAPQLYDSIRNSTPN